MEAYEDMIRATSAPHAPWFVVPADNKWYTRLIVSLAIADCLVDLDLAYPKVDATQLEGLKAARARLMAGNNRGRR